VTLRSPHGHPAAAGARPAFNWRALADPVAVLITPDVQHVVPALPTAAPALIAGVRALESF